MPENNQDHIPKPSSNKIPENSSIEWQKETQTQKTREQLKEELKNMTEYQLVSRIVSLLKRKYPDNAEAFSKDTIKVWYLPDLFEVTWTRLYLTFSPHDGKLLSYIDNQGETLLDMTEFLIERSTRIKNKIYAKWKESNGNKQRVLWFQRDKKTWKLFFIDGDWGKHIEWNDEFNKRIMMVFLRKKLYDLSKSK